MDNDWNAKDVIGLKGSISFKGAEASGNIGGDKIDPKKFDDVYKDMGKLSNKELKEKACKDLPDCKLDDEDDVVAEKKAGKQLKK